MHTETKMRGGVVWCRYLQRNTRNDTELNGQRRRKCRQIISNDTAAGRVCAFEKSTNVSKPAGHQSTSSEKRLDAPTATPTLKTALKVSDGPSSVGSVGRTHSTEILAALRQPANHLYIHAFKVRLSCRMLRLLLLPCCRHHSQTQASRTPSAVAVRSGSRRMQQLR